MIYNCDVININPSIIKRIKQEVNKKRDLLILIFCIISLLICFFSIILDIFLLSLFVFIVFPILFIIVMLFYYKRFNKEVELIRHCKYKKELIKVLILNNKIYFIDKRGKNFKSLIFNEKSLIISNNKVNTLDLKSQKIYLSKSKVEDDLS